jgi:hypothetical protein
VFHIEFFCDDKKVGDALRGLMGIAIGVPVAKPVVNAEIKSTGEIEQQTNGNLANRFIHFLSNYKGDTILPRETKDWLEKQGMSRLSANYVQKAALAAGVLKKAGSGSGTIYHIIRALPKPKRGGTHG